MKVHSFKLITASVFVIKNIGAEVDTLLSFIISIFELSQLKVLVPLSASPDID